MIRPGWPACFDSGDNRRVNTPVAPDAGFPRRIVCLTEETTETLFLLGQQDRIVGISGYTVRPPEARRKPKVSAFINANFDKIVGLEPDLVLAFSDLQADIAAELIRRGLNVVAFNQRSVGQILDMILALGRLVGCGPAARELVAELGRGLEEIRASAARLDRRPRVFFEEWNDPLISGIRWVDELIEIAGGRSPFPELRTRPLARDRILEPSEVARRNPEIVIGSWCGVRFKPDFVRARPGWDRTDAVANDHLYEIKSTYLLQPGPAALTEGVRQIHAVIAAVMGLDVPASLMPAEKTDPRIRSRPPTRAKRPDPAHPPNPPGE
jgi:iron complex transport system substrate-binding protein